jgi:hypothetical protein
MLFVAALLITACVNQECEALRPDPELNVAFKKYTDATRTRQKSADTLINITRTYAVGLEDKPFLTAPAENPDILSKTVILRLNPSADSTIFHLEGKAADKTPFDFSFTVTYTRQYEFISQACGFEVKYTNLAVEAPSTTFDDIVVIVPEIDPIRNEIHIQLYLLP